VKKQWQIDVVSTFYLTCHYICNRSHSSQTAWCPQATILIGFTIRDHKRSV